MIIKIDVDDGIDRSDAMAIANHILSTGNITVGSKSVSVFSKLVAKVTQYSRAGNIFIHVSKTEK